MSAGVTDQRPSVSIIICAHSTHRWEQLRNALDSALSEHPDEVLIVIDHNVDLLRLATDALESHNSHPRVRIVANDNAKGLSGARNTGIALTTSAITAFIDDDAEALPGWLGHLISPFDDPTVVAVGGRALPARPDHFPARWPHEYDWVVGCSWTGLPEVLSEVRNVIGCTMAFRHEALIATDGFDVRLGRVGSNAAGCEETELCLRLSRGGDRVLYEPKATVLHHIDTGRLTPRYFIRRCWAEGRSKALIRRTRGGGTLGPERQFAVDALRRSFRNGAGAIIRRDATGIARAAATLGGLCTTGLAFVLPMPGPAVSSTTKRFR